MERWSARKWFARILITWGFCSMGMALVRTPGQFYLSRFLLGLAESGFFPGVIVYLTHWFPRAERGRALAGMVLAVPVSLCAGSRVSGALLEVKWFGLEGWQWVFLVEGLPAVAPGRGRAVPHDGPAPSRRGGSTPPSGSGWNERWRRSAAGDGGRGGRDAWQALRSPAVWLLALGILATNTGGYALSLLAADGREELPARDAGGGRRFRRALLAGPVFPAAWRASGCRASLPTEPATGNGTASRGRC